MDPLDAGLPLGRFAWHDLMTHDVERARSYYAGLLGWTYEDTEIPGFGTYSLIRTAGRSWGKPAGGMLPKPPGSGGPSSWLVYVAVENADATAARVRELGGSVQVEPTDIPGMGRFLVTSDPAGAMIAFIQPAG